jgi:hypothetical protein
VPFGNLAAVATAAIALLADDQGRKAMSARANLYSQSMVWTRVAQSPMAAFLRARTGRAEMVPARFNVQASAGDVEQRVANA